MTHSQSTGLLARKTEIRLSVDNMRFPCVGTNINRKTNRKTEKRRLLFVSVVCYPHSFERVKKRARSASPPLIG